MAKAFFDVFPGLKLDGKLKSLFEQTQIERVTATKQKDFVRIYLSSERLIQKDDIFTVEGEIKKQLFAGCNITIKIHESTASLPSITRKSSWKFTGTAYCLSCRNTAIFFTVCLKMRSFPSLRRAGSTCV